jgi:hypothetical protein
MKPGAYPQVIRSAEAGPGMASSGRFGSADGWHDLHMTYDLAVWEGERPVDDEAGTKYYMEHVASALGNYEESDVLDEPPTPRIRAYVEALLERWPELDTDEGDSSPWCTAPLIGEAWGSFIYFGLVWSMAEEASAFAADLAQQHGLVCYDPGLERLRP